MLTPASLRNRFFFGVTVFEAGAGGETVSLPVASVLAIVTAALCAGVDPSGLPRGNHLSARCIHVAVGTWRGVEHRGNVTKTTTCLLPT